MLTQRLTFRAHYGRCDDLAALFRERTVMFDAPEVKGARLFTDATGPMFTVAIETDFEDLSAYAAFEARMHADFATPEFAAWFERMAAVTEGGERQLFASERLR